jgi:hypothetical protein
MLATTISSVQFNEICYRLASISSSVNPFVSGTMKNMKARDATAITLNPEKSMQVRGQIHINSEVTNDHIHIINILQV